MRYETTVRRVWNLKWFLVVGMIAFVGFGGPIVGAVQGLDTPNDGIEMVAANGEGNVSVTIDSTNAPIVEGETLEVTATLENTGRLVETKTVELSTGDTVRDSVEVSLDSGEARKVALSWATDDGDVGTHTATVAAGNASDTRDVRVGEPATFAVSVDSTNSPVVEGESMEVTAIVENTGDAADTRVVELSINGTVRDSIPVTLNPGESRKVALLWATDDGDGGEYEAVVSSSADSVRSEVTVHDGAEFSVHIDSTNSPVTVGVRDSHNLEINVTVSNNGDLPGNKTVTLSVGAVDVDTRDVTLDGGESTAVTLRWSVGETDTGSHTVEVRTGNDTATREIEVREPSNLDVSYDGDNHPSSRGRH